MPAASAVARFGSATPLELRPPRGIARRRRDSDHHLLTEDLFTAALDRELKRAGRFDESFALLVISLNTDDGDPAWADVVQILTTARSDGDVIGWLKQGAAAGLIRPLIHLKPAEAAASLAAAVQCELGRLFGRDTAAASSIRLDVYYRRCNRLAPVVVPEFTRPPTLSERAAKASKRALDIAGSVALLAVLSPAVLVIAGSIKFTSKGPVLFRQKRLGQNGRPFTMLKFRTMYVNADDRIHQQYVTRLIESGAPAEAGSTKMFKIVKDSRVTPVGQFLRRSSLDEVPQFWNVLVGAMSLVGPRPPLAYEVAHYKHWHCQRLWEVKPGITGLWQVSGRSCLSFDEMVRLDLQYARKRSLWMDIRILLATPRAVLSGKGAL